MFNELRQSEFQSAEFDSSALNLHISDATARDAVFVFVHGWGGSGYKTWGDLLPLLFNGAAGEGVDVATFNYVSGLRRLVNRGHLWGQKSDLAFWSRQLSDHFESLCARYKDVYVIGHSMGGQIVQEAAYSHLIAEAFSGERISSSLSALVLIASPRSGTGWAMPGVGRLVAEYPVLRTFGEQSEKIDSFFATRVEQQNLASGEPGQIVLPLYAAIGGRDKVVSRFSAMFGVIEKQRLRLDANHRTIVKPSETDMVLPKWLLNDVHTSRAGVKRQSERNARHEEARIAKGIRLAEAPVVTKFLTDTFGLEWEEIYHQARSEAASGGLELGDSREHPGVPVDLVVAVNAAGPIADDHGLRSRTLRLLADDRTAHPSATVGICPVGVEFEMAEEVIRDDVQSYPELNGSYVTGAADSDSLAAVFTRLLRVVMGRRPGVNTVGALATIPQENVPLLEGDPTRGAVL